MSRYIDADALAEKFHKMGLGENSLIEKLFADGVYAIIDTFLTADVEPVRHGYWILTQKISENAFRYNCSECNRWVQDGVGKDPSDRYPYCHCGAKMDGKETE